MGCLAVSAVWKAGRAHDSDEGASALGGGSVCWQSTLAPLHLSGLLYHEDVWRLNRVLPLYFGYVLVHVAMGIFKHGYRWCRAATLAHTGVQDVGESTGCS